MTENENDEEEIFFTVADAAKRWKMTQGTLYKMVADGRLKKLKIGSLVRISFSEIQAFESENTSGGDNDGR